MAKKRDTLRRAGEGSLWEATPDAEKTVARTGFSEKTLWDLLQLLIFPLVLAGMGLLFEMQQD
jgi:hypothetical protein